MTSQQWKAVLKTARRLQKEEEKIDKALKGFCTAISPSMYNLYIEKGMVHGYLEAIEACHGADARYNVSYWLYEVPSMMEHYGDCEVKDQHGKAYDASKVDEYVKFIMAV
jgi:hypothetical protein